MSSTANMMRRTPSVFAGASCGTPSTAAGAWNFASSTRPGPPGIRSMATSCRTSSIPITRSTHRPSTGPLPSSSMPRSTKNAMTASRSSTTMRTLSIRWIAMPAPSLVWFIVAGTKPPGRPRHATGRGPAGPRPATVSGWTRRRPGRPRPSAAGLVGGLAARAVEVVLGDGGEAGLDLRGDLPAVEGGDRLVHAVLADDAGLLGDQRLHGALLQGLDLVRPGIEAHDLDGAGL